ncbi:hypothetical protein H072_8497 [Dactylellina haptotyla CBS 200.50]|uniref:Extracellular membrane protein CFEM domain-containing protein n=1 Tax=Dactylellina haptotyla (strain CBS 200.50) TaxID=1284197 RepID=S8BF90_DACHA|nr:hypothetical protein H072_8497 [Dactylellina haptotyla CBS 200.50]
MGRSSIFLRLSLILLAINPLVSAGRKHKRPGVVPQFVHKNPTPAALVRARQQATDKQPVSYEDFPADLEYADYCLITKNQNYIGCDATTAPCKHSDKTCTYVDHDCFCDNPTVLACAWYTSWFDYFKIEDWFSDQCPEVPKIDFSGLPACAKTCLVQAVTDYGCVSYTRNCFCVEGWLWGCGDSCNDADKQQVLTWYGDQCLLTPSEVEDLDLINPAATSQAAGFNAPDNGGTQAKSDENGPGTYRLGHRKLHWYEIYGLIMFLLTLVFVTTMYGFIWKSKYKVYKKNQVYLNRSVNPSSEKLSSTRKSIEKKPMQEKA